MFPGAVLHHFAVVGSGRLMLLLHTEVAASKWRKRFIYDPGWGEDEGCSGVVKCGWTQRFKGSRGGLGMEKLPWVQRGLLDWRLLEWRVRRCVLIY